MKKLLMGTICLALFAITLSLVQISCSKTEAQNSTSQVTSINKILYKEVMPGMLRYSIANYDGSGIQHLNIPFPAGFVTSTTHNPVLSPDGTKIFFEGRETANLNYGIYKCDTSGANFMRIIDLDPSTMDGQISGAY